MESHFAKDICFDSFIRGCCFLLGGSDSAELREGLLQRLVADAIGQVAYVKFVSHWGSPFKEKKPCGASTQRDPSSEGGATRHSIIGRQLREAAAALE